MTVGYILSPASWWNDAVVNLPIAIAFGWLAAKVSESLFLPVTIVAYWITNVVGIAMLHLGAVYVLKKESPRGHWNLRRILLVSSVYTLIVVALAKWGLVEAPF